MDYLLAILGASIGIMILFFVIGVAVYVLFSISHMKALKALGYKNAWLAWIPYGVWFACADSVTQGEENVKLFDSIEIPAIIFKLWWVIPLAFAFLPVNPRVENIINLAMNVIFLGCTYAKMYARIEGRAEKDEQVLGCVSGFLPIIAVIKFLMV